MECTRDVWQGSTAPAWRACVRINKSLSPRQARCKRRKLPTTRRATRRRSTRTAARCAHPCASAHATAARRRRSTRRRDRCQCPKDVASSRQQGARTRTAGICEIANQSNWQRSSYIERGPTDECASAPAFLASFLGASCFGLLEGAGASAPPSSEHGSGRTTGHTYRDMPLLISPRRRTADSELLAWNT